MDGFRDAFILVAFIFSLLSIGGVVVGGKRLLGVLDAFRMTISNLNESLRGLGKDIRGVKQSTDRIDDQLNEHTRQIADLQEETGE